jgi:hypothetical protein
MPRGPKGEKRLADAIGNAVQVMRIATGEIEEKTTADGKNPVALGRQGARRWYDSQEAERDSEEGCSKTLAEITGSIFLRPFFGGRHTQ